MSKLNPPDLVAASQWQDWIATVLPLLYITTLTILLPTILTQSFVVTELGSTQEQRLRRHLRSISIKILAHGETIGSGVLLTKQERVYTVVTNAHVIQSASGQFQLQTHDGQIYAAALITPPTGQNRDLSILRFQSREHVYITAKLATALPKTGDRVWSSGFSHENRVEDTAKAVLNPTIVKGQIVQVLPIAIAGGYSIGSDRSIDKGMSGGALINRSGELIGINGVHANPLWDKPEVLEDGSKVSDVLQEQIKNSNWAIPTQFIKNYAKL
jgi:S1-C subfamily serine protease